MTGAVQNSHHNSGSNWVDEVKAEVKEDLQDMGKNTKNAGVKLLASLLDDEAEDHGKDISLSQCLKMVADLKGRPLTDAESAAVASVINNSVTATVTTAKARHKEEQRTSDVQTAEQKVLDNLKTAQQANDIANEQTPFLKKQA